MKNLLNFLIGKEVFVGEVAYVTDVFLGDEITITYEGSDGCGSGDFSLKADTVTEFLGSPFGDVPSKLGNDIYVLAQTGYSTGKGVSVMFYDSATDTISESFLAQIAV